MFGASNTAGVIIFAVVYGFFSGGCKLTPLKNGAHTTTDACYWQGFLCCLQRLRSCPRTSERLGELIFSTRGVLQVLNRMLKRQNRHCVLHHVLGGPHRYAHCRSFAQRRQLGEFDSFQRGMHSTLFIHDCLVKGFWSSLLGCHPCWRGMPHDLPSNVHQKTRHSAYLSPVTRL